jgi:trans-aconitate methyltransferase
MTYQWDILYLLFHFTPEEKEGFTLLHEQDGLKNKIYKNEKIYDNFYTYIYDDVMLTIPYYIELIQIIHTYFYTYGETLCIGSKTGHLTQLLSKTTQTTGLDTSKSMVKMSQYKYPEGKFLQGDYFDSTLFERNKFNHIIIPLLTIHTLPNISDLFSTLKGWTVQGGYLFVSFTDITTFPVYKLVNHMPSSYFISNYEYTIELKENKLKETIKDNNFKERTNIQELYDYNEKQIIYHARRSDYVHVTTLKYDSIPFYVAVFKLK